MIPQRLKNGCTAAFCGEIGIGRGGVMEKYYLAVDIGASSGRHFLGSCSGGKLSLQEMYRFDNRLARKGGHLCWDADHLFREILNGMKRCALAGKIPASMGIDTWGVDFVLLDREQKRLGDAVSYRDSRTAAVLPQVEELFPAERLFERTGIQRQSFNTVYQLYALRKEHPEYLERAERFLMMPEYFGFLLTGVPMNEYTNATTTGLVNVSTRGWDAEVMEKLGIPSGIFGELNPPGTPVGRLSAEIREEAGFDCEVVLPATHDTASAVMAVPARKGERSLFLSSGTWSLMGMERLQADCRETSRRMDFTNEGGYGFRYCFLKNIMGLWMIQRARRELPQPYSFDDLCLMAEENDGFPSRIDVGDPAFLAPESMTEAVRAYCRRSGQPAPSSEGELFACIYRSLADSYADTAQKLESAAGEPCPVVRIVGGGAKDEYLNRLTAAQTGRTVYAGPAEATAIGNLLAQMLRDGVFSDLWEARAAVARSFEIRKR